MRYEIIFTPEAIDDLRSLAANDRASVLSVMEKCLRHEPAKTSKTRIKRLRDISHPQFRLRVDDIRVYYDVTGDSVEILAIVPKDKSNDWLKTFGVLE